MTQTTAQYLATLLAQAWEAYDQAKLHGTKEEIYEAESRVFQYQAQFSAAAQGK